MPAILIALARILCGIGLGSGSFKETEFARAATAGGFPHPGETVEPFRITLRPVPPCPALKRSSILRTNRDATNPFSSPLDRSRRGARGARQPALRMDHHRSQGQALREG